AMRLLAAPAGGVRAGAAATASWGSLEWGMRPPWMAYGRPDPRRRAWRWRQGWTGGVAGTGTRRRAASGLLLHQPSPPGDSAAGTARRACARLSAGLRTPGFRTPWRPPLPPL